jgi:fructoselysine 6-kinase
MRMCAIGDNVVDRYPEEALAFPGGSAANVAVFARRLGWDSAYLGIVGADAEGSLITDALGTEGVDLSHAMYRDEPNSTTDVVIEPGGNRVFTGFVPPASKIELNEEDLGFISGSDWIHTGHSSFTEHELPLLARLAPVSFDFSYKDFHYASTLLRHVTYAAYSRDSWTYDECVALLEQTIEAGASLALVTRGSKGAVARTRDGLYVQDAVPVEAVDTIGAGDAFQACLLTSILGGRPVPEALEKASTFAATVCTYRGAYGYASTMTAKEG